MSVDFAVRPAVTLTRTIEGRAGEVLTSEALDFLAELHRRFNDRRLELLALREERQTRYDAGLAPDFLAETAPIRAGDWKVAPIPADILDHRLDFDGRNSGPMVVLADFEDASSPTWSNMIEGQVELKDRWSVRSASPRPTTEQAPTLFVRPRGWHLPEAHAVVDGEEMGGALFDFGLYVFHNARAAIAAGSGPYLDLPKIENHLEARLWAQVFDFAERALGLPSPAIKATVLIEALPAAFETDEILFELRDHAVGLYCGRRDYIFSFIKRLKTHPEALTPDRAVMGTEPAFVAACSRKLIESCQRRGALVFGRGAGETGSPPAAGQAAVTRAELLRVADGERTEAGLRENIRILVQYVEAWLRGRGAMPLYDLMGDVATAEISRAQVWQWIRHRATLSDGREVTPELFRGLLDEEMAALRLALPAGGFETGRFAEAVAIFDEMSLSDTFEEFLTLPAYRILA